MMENGVCLRPVPENIRNNGRNKMLIIGKTGVGKSSLCNVICGLPRNAKAFPVSPEATACTHTTQLADAFFGNNKTLPFSLIDTMGFDDPTRDVDAVIIGELVATLKERVDFVNTFVIAINGQHPRLDGSLITMIRIFEGMFGEEFWNQTLIAFTRLPKDKSSVKRRERGNDGKTDDDMAKDYISVLQNQFQNARGIDYLFLDANYDEEDDVEVAAFDNGMAKLWKKIQCSKGLSTDTVKKVTTENKKLKNKVEAFQKWIQGGATVLKTTGAGTVAGFTTGGASGASVGALAGAPVGGLGAVPGALIGAAVGAFGGAFVGGIGGAISGDGAAFVTNGVSVIQEALFSNEVVDGENVSNKPDEIMEQ